MSYRCGICDAVVGKGRPLKRHTVSRVRPGTTYQEIASEIPLCDSCDDELRRGTTLAQLRKRVGRSRAVPKPLAAIPAPMLGVE